MATINQNYANLLTLRFYNALYVPAPIRPSELPNLSVFSKNPVNKQRQPNDCVGFCMQTKLSKIDMTISFTTDSFGGENTPQQEYKRCIDARVISSVSEEESSECLTRSDYNNAVTRYGLKDGSPYRAFRLVPSVSNGSLNLKGESFIIRDSGVCDYCLLKNKLCSSTKNRNYSQTHKVCQNRIGNLPTNPGPNYPQVSPDIQEYRHSGYNTSWIFREALLGLINSGGFQFETNCGCEGVPATKPTTSVPVLTELESTNISSRTTTEFGGGTPTTSRSTSVSFPRSSVIPTERRSY